MQFQTVNERVRVLQRWKQESLNIAADICIYTNHNLVIEKLSLLRKVKKEKMPLKHQSTKSH